jgi:hypothetical protein
MSRSGALRPTVVLGIALITLALGLAGAGPLTSREEPAKAAPLVNLVEPSACVADEPLASTIQMPGANFEPAAVGRCKACKLQPWCGCTYQGHPRISCDPCCYQAYPQPICLS